MAGEAILGALLGLGIGRGAREAGKWASDKGFEKGLERRATLHQLGIDEELARREALTPSSMDILEQELALRTQAAIDQYKGQFDIQQAALNLKGEKNKAIAEALFGARLSRYDNTGAPDQQTTTSPSSQAAPGSLDAAVSKPFTPEQRAANEALLADARFGGLGPQLPPEHQEDPLFPDQPAPVSSPLDVLGQAPDWLKTAASATGLGALRQYWNLRGREDRARSAEQIAAVKQARAGLANAYPQGFRENLLQQFMPTDREWTKDERDQAMEVIDDIIMDTEEKMVAQGGKDGLRAAGTAGRREAVANRVLGVQRELEEVNRRIDQQQGKPVLVSQTTGASRRADNTARDMAPDMELSDFDQQQGEDLVSEIVNNIGTERSPGRQKTALRRTVSGRPTRQQEAAAILLERQILEIDSTLDPSDVQKMVYQQLGIKQPDEMSAYQQASYDLAERRYEHVKKMNESAEQRAWAETGTKRMKARTEQLKAERVKYGWVKDLREIRLETESGAKPVDKAIQIAETIKTQMAGKSLTEIENLPAGIATQLLADADYALRNLQADAFWAWGMNPERIGPAQRRIDWPIQPKDPNNPTPEELRQMARGTGQIYWLKPGASKSFEGSGDVAMPLSLAEGAIGAEMLAALLKRTPAQPMP